jgi:class 3 adenylate cyclase
MDYEPALSSFSLALEHARATENLHLQVAPLVRGGSVMLTLGRLGEAERQLQEAARLASRCDAGEHAFALSHLCALAGARGELAAAEELGAEMVRLLGRTDGRPWAPLSGIPALAFARQAAGDVDGAHVALQALREPGRWVERISGAEHVLSLTLQDWLAARAGAPKDDDAAGGRRARVERYAQRIDLKTADGMGLCAVAALAELCVYYQLPWAVDGPRRVLQRAMQQGALLTTGWPFCIPRVLGNVEAAFGEPDAAARLLQSAIDGCDDSGARLEAAVARVDRARALVARGQTGGHDAGRDARALLQPALDTLAELGVASELPAARNLAGALGLRVPDSTPPPPPRPADLRFVHQLMGAEQVDRLGEQYLLSPEGMRRRAAGVLHRLGVRRPLDAAGELFDSGLIAGPGPQPGLPLVLMVTDLVGFTPMVERLGDADAQRVIRAHNALLRAQVRDHGGLEITHTGDGIVASFRSVPEAVSCAAALQAAFARRNDAGELPPLHIRIGIHAGEPLLEEGRLFGAAVIAAVRICSQCEADRILVSDVVRGSARGVTFRFVARGAHRLKGFREPMALHEVLWRSEQPAQPV